jgi:hypothetical protein
MNINLGISLAGLNDVFIHKQTTPSAPVTGTLTETQVYALTIPANSFAAGDKFVLDNLIVSKTGTAGTATIRVKLSTSSTMPGGTTDRIIDLTFANNILSSFFHRYFNVFSNNLHGLGLGSATNQNANFTVALATFPFNPTVTNYLYFSVQLANTADSVTVHGYTLKNF